MIKFPGTSVFAYGARLHQPDPIAANVSRARLAQSTAGSETAARLRNASVGVPAASVDNLKASGLTVRGS